MVLARFLVLGLLFIYLFSIIEGQSISSIPNNVYTNQVVLVTWTYQACIGTRFKLEICTSGVISPSCSVLASTTDTKHSFTVSQNAGTYFIRLTHFSTTNGCALKKTDTNAFQVIKCAALSITSQPTAVVTPVNTAASFLARVSGTAVSYQWYFNGVAINGAHSNIFSIANVLAANQGTYFARAIDPCGKSITTNIVALTVCQPLELGYVDQTVEVLFGGSVDLIIPAEGTGLQFQWQQGTTVLSTIGNTHSIVNATQLQAAIYSVRVTDACRRERSVAIEVVIFPFVIQQQPPHVTRLFLGETATLSVTAIGETGLTYQWLVNGQRVDGATGTSITTEEFTWAMNGTIYTVEVTDGTKTIMSNPAWIVAQPPPFIVSLTPSIVPPLFLRQSVVLHVQTEGAALSFSWMVDNEVIAVGSGLNSYTFTATALTQDGSRLHVNVSNVNGYAVSDPIILDIQPPPIFTRGTSPRTMLLLAGEVSTIDMSREVTGNQMTFQWLKNNQTVLSETTQMLTLSPYQMTLDSYQLIASNPSGDAYGPIIRTEPEPAPKILSSTTASVYFFYNDRPNISVTVSGRGISYRWFKGSQLLPNSNSSSITLPPLQFTDDDTEVRVEAFNANGMNFTTFTLLLDSPPTITRDPFDSFPYLRQDVVFSVRATGRKLQFDWELTPALPFEVTRTTATESYIIVRDVRVVFHVQVTVTNPAGSVTSKTARVFIKGPPEILIFPPVTNVIVNEHAAITAVATGDRLYYTWLINGVTRRVNGTSDTWVIPRVTEQMDGDVYKVIVSNPSGAVSQETRLSVITSPQIVVRPERNYRIFTGTSLNIVVNATGGDVYYIWHHNDVLLQNSTANTLKIESASSATQGTYSLTLLNIAGSYGPMTFSVEVSEVVFNRNHDIQVNTFAGLPLELSVSLITSVSQSEMTFIWTLNRIKIESATGPRLFIPALAAEDAGEYFLTISHPQFSVKYANVVAVVKLLGKPQLERKLESVRVKSGQTASFSITAYPKTQLKFQWIRNGRNITNGNESAFSIAETELDMDGDVFSVIAYNPAGHIESNEVVLYVDLAESWTIFIIVACLLIFAGCMVATLIVVRRKLKERKNITYTKANFGIDKVLYPISKTWVPPESSTLCNAEKLPVVFSKTALDFGSHGDQFDLNAEYYDSVTVRWKRSLIAKSGVKSKRPGPELLSDNPNDMAIPLLNMGKKKSLTIVFHVPETHKYLLTANPCEVELQPRSKKRSTSNLTDEDPTAVEIDFTFKMHITTDVSVLIGVEFPDLDKHFFLTLDASSRLSPWIDIDEIKMDEKPIGEGGFGIVFKGEYRGQIVAAKVLKMQDLLDDDNLEEFEREIKMLSILRHKNIVSFVGASKLKGKLAIVTEFIPNGSLEQLLHKKAVRYLVKLRIALETAQAIAFLHNNNVLHRDIKVENVLLASLDLTSNAGLVKLSDFGSARTISDQRAATFTKGIGTPIYMAPEVLNNERYDTKADVYSFGILLWVLISQKEPYTAFTHSWDVAKFVIDGHREAIPAGCPYDYATLIRRCWNQVPEQRPTIHEVIDIITMMYDRELENDVKIQ